MKLTDVFYRLFSYFPKHELLQEFGHTVWLIYDLKSKNVLRKMITIVI